MSGVQKLKLYHIVYLYIVTQLNLFYSIHTQLDRKRISVLLLERTNNVYRSTECMKYYRDRRIRWVNKITAQN